MAQGYAAQATAMSAVAIGGAQNVPNQTRATATYATAIGFGANAGASGAIAIGRHANHDIKSTAPTSAGRSKTTGADSIAIGTDTHAGGESALAIGKGAQATAKNAISIGVGNVVSGENSGALGDPSYITGSGTYTIGNDNGTAADPIAANNAGAFGNLNRMTAAAENSRVVGNYNHITTANTYVLGSGINSDTAGNTLGATVSNSVYLGNDSQATGGAAATPGTLFNTDVLNQTGTTTSAGAEGTVGSAIVGGITYGSFAGQKAVGAVTVGAAGSERRIQNVAAGEIAATSTDAINGSQLHATQTAIGNLASSTAAHLGGGAAVQANGSISAPTYTINGTPYSNVGAALAALNTAATAAGTHYYHVNSTNQAAGSNYANDGATGQNALAAGVKASAAGTDAVAVGSDATASGAQSLAVGNNVQATHLGATAVGNNSRATADSAQAFGQSSQASAKDAVAVGRYARSQGERASAFGVGNLASGASAVSVGDSSQATSAGSIAIGSPYTENGVTYASKAWSDNAIAIGSGAEAGLDKNAPTNTNAGKTGAIAIGTKALAYEVSAVAMGEKSGAFGVNSLALGANATSNNNSGVAIGDSATSNAVNALAIGTNTKAEHTSAVAIGDGAHANNAAYASVALGNNAKTQASQSLAAGFGAEVTVSDAVALGSSAVANRAALTPSAATSSSASAAANTVYASDAATAADKAAISATVKGALGAVSVGSGTATRQIINVAAGSENTDAVNVAQLKAVANQAAAQASVPLTFAGDRGTNVTRSLGTTLNITGGAAATAALTNSNIAVVSNGTDTLNVQLAQNLTGLSSAQFTDAAGNTSTVNGAGTTVTDTAGNTTTTNASGITITPAAGGGNAVSLTTTGLNNGGNRITNVANGAISATSTDAVNGSQLYAVAGNVTNVSNVLGGNNTYIGSDGTLTAAGEQALKTYDVSGQTATKNSNVIDAIKIMNEGGIKYFHTNDASGQTTGGTLAVGTNDSSASGSYSTAVGYEASATAQNALAIGRGAQALGISSISIGTGNVVNAARSGAIGDPTTIIASATDSYSIGNNNTVNTADTFVMGNNVTTTVGNSVYLGANAAATAPATAQSAGTTAYNSATINGTTYNYAGGTPAGAVTVGSVGGERRIQNVAAGLISATSTDAINGSQLYTAYEAINALSISSGAGWNLQANGNTTAITPINPTLNVIDGSNTTVSLTGNQLQVNVVNNPTFSGPVTANGGLSVGNNLTVQPGTTVDMGGNRITNVADGQAPTDAVTVQQLQNAQMGNAGQVGVLADRIHQVSRNADAGTASAMAMAGLPQAYLPGKSMIAAGASAYRGASAIAVGLSTISDNGKWILKGTISGNNRGHVGAAVGAGYQW